MERVDPDRQPIRKIGPADLACLQAKDDWNADAGRNQFKRIFVPGDSDVPSSAEGG